MLHVINARCVERHLHTIAPVPLERTCWRRFEAQLGDCKKSRIAPLNAMMMTMMMMITLFDAVFGTII